MAAFGYSASAIAALGLALCARPSFAQSPSSPLTLSAEDAARLGRGEAVVRAVGGPKELSLAVGGEFADELRSRIASLRPNYLSEVMLVIPYRKGAVEKLAADLADVKAFVGIPYYSQRNKTTYPLFDKVEIRARGKTSGEESIEAWQHMEPFTDFSSTYLSRLRVAALGSGTELFFKNENTSPIGYNGIQAVAPGNMVWMLYAFPSGNSIFFYGVGGVRAFDMLGTLRDRLESAFLGRVEAFFTYMSKKLKG